MKSKLRPLLLIATAAALCGYGSHSAAAADHFDGPAQLSPYAAYARQVAAECVRNRAYGTTTNGLPLEAFCEMLGNTEALKIRNRSLSQNSAAGKQHVGSHW